MAQLWEIENFLDIRNEQLHIDGVNATDLAHERGTPLFVYSEKRIRHNIERLRKSAEVIDCPLKLCYAAKAMSTMGILHSVKEAACDIEVNSGGELWKALEAGFAGEQIIFNGTSKEVWELEMAIDNSIYAIQVDSIFELSQIEEIAKRVGKKAWVSLRLVPEIETGTHSGLQTALLTSKFGMMPEEAFEACRRYGESRHLHIAGVHLHIGSQNPEPHAYEAAFTMLFESMLRIYNEAGISLQHINLGGGFPVNYLRDASQRSEFPSEQREMFAANFEPAEAIKQAWQGVKNLAAQSNAEHLLDGLTLLLEPGRSIIADAGICLTTVRNSKTRPVAPTADNGHPTTDSWLLTDAGFNILLSMETYKWYYHLISAERSGEAHTAQYKLAGPLCDGGDVYFDHEGYGRLPEHRLLPENVEPGEILALLNCGAYALAQASQYNGRFLPPVVLIKENGSAELIRRRESFGDLVASDL
ncbi:MAG: diaminopimelate decarboxylase [Acidobacteria bacterium]|nr:MAG: diaminopimelate decarboxylase [Acidobacteriota bacterium]